MVFLLCLSHQGVKALQQKDPFTVEWIALMFICPLVPGLSLLGRNGASCLFTCPKSSCISQPFIAPLHREQVGKPRHRAMCANVAPCPYCLLCPGARLHVSIHRKPNKLLM